MQYVFCQAKYMFFCYKNGISNGSRRRAKPDEREQSERNPSAKYARVSQTAGRETQGNPYKSEQSHFLAANVPLRINCRLPLSAAENSIFIFVQNISNGSFSEVHLTLKSYCFSAFLPEVWHSVAHHDLICDIRILGKKWGKSALHGEKTGKIFNTNQPILKPGPARQAPIYCGSSDVVAERFFAAYYLPIIPTDLKT